MRRELTAHDVDRMKPATQAGQGRGCEALAAPHLGGETSPVTTTAARREGTGGGGSPSQKTCPPGASRHTFRGGGAGLCKTGRERRRRVHARPSPRKRRRRDHES